jgi:uncharacterized membrane protein (UPF0182 family)
MRAPNDMPRRRRTRAPGRVRLVAIIVAIVVFIVITFLRQIAEFWTDYLWFDSVGLSKVWSRTLAIKIELGLIFTVAFFGVLWVNLLIADRAAPKFPPIGPDEELLSRYHQIVDRRAGSLRFIVALVCAIITGAQMSGQWNEWVLFTYGRDFGVSDPQFGADVGFYMFRLPFLVSLVDWLFAALVIVLLITAAAHYLNGSIRLQAPFERVTPQVKAHISVLLALLALVKAGDYWLQHYQIVFADRGVVNGASFTEVNAQLPAIYLLLFIAGASFVLFIINIRRRGWVYPVAAIGLWIFVQLIVGEVYPAVYQQAVVRPEESTKETQAIKNNIEATNAAYGLSGVKLSDFTSSSDVPAAEKAITAHPEITRNVQLLDPNRVDDTFQKLQQIIAPSHFASVTADRYPMKLPSGEIAETQVVIANREMRSDAIPQKSWEGLHLDYTHGYGLALAASNAVANGGSPDFAISGIPLASAPSIDLSVDQPNNYYFNTGGSDTPTAQLYSVVDTSAPEFDYIKNSGDPAKAYAGNGGVQLDSFGRRLAFSIKYADPYLLISQFITDQSRLLYVRDVRQRVQTAAPFLTFDSDPYPVVADHHTYYVIDGYTTSDFYPNSQRYPGSPSVTPGHLGSAQEPFNYVRNSVKAVVDTYDGSMKFFVVDRTDPLIEAYREAFPDLFHDQSEISQDLKAHLRYPQDIFKVQTDMYGRYHLTNPTDFYKQENAWEPPIAPSIKVEVSTAPAGGTPNQQAAVTGTPTQDRIAPYYVINQFAGDAQPGFMLMRSYQPYSPNSTTGVLSAFMVARCDGDDLGKLQAFRISQDGVPGPTIVSQKMLSDSAVSSTITALNQQGSSALFSDLVLVPIDQSILYVRAMYVQSSDTKQPPQPIVRNVIVFFNNTVVIKPTLREALQTMFPNSKPQTLEGGEAPDSAGANGGTTTPTSSTTQPENLGTSQGTSSTIPRAGDGADQLVDEANQLLQEAQDALKSGAPGSLGVYQEKVDQAKKKLDEARALREGAAPTSTSSTSSTSSSSSSSTSSTAAPAP